MPMGGPKSITDVLLFPLPYSRGSVFPLPYSCGSVCPLPYSRGSVLC
jgi:hypothetical protein